MKQTINLNNETRYQIAFRREIDHANYCVSRAMNPCKMGREFQSNREEKIQEALKYTDQYSIESIVECVKKNQTLENYNSHGNHMSQSTFDYIMKSI